MNIHHKELSTGKWGKLSLAEQLANVGSEIERTIRWRKKENNKYSQLAFDRALELLDLTISDKKNNSRLKEILRLREVLSDYFAFENKYNSTDKKWKDYFLAFNYAARVNSN